MLAHPRPQAVSELRAGGASIRYLDTGEADSRPVLFFGGLATSAAAFTLTELCGGAERRRLNLRFVSVERNGFGETPFTAGSGFSEAVEAVTAVADALALRSFAVVAISGGGPYAARLLERAGDRVLSVHLAAASAGGPLAARAAGAALLRRVEAIARDPAAFWEYPPESGVHAIPGFMEAAREEGRRALPDPVRGAAALRHELELLGSEPLPDLRAVRAPAYLYWGEEDALVPLEHLREWRAALGGVAAERVYAGEGHDVQYLHWREILADIAGTPDER